MEGVFVYSLIHSEVILRERSGAMAVLVCCVPEAWGGADNEQKLERWLVELPDVAHSGVRATHD